MGFPSILFAIYRGGGEEGIDGGVPRYSVVIDMTNKKGCQVYSSTIADTDGVAEGDSRSTTSCRAVSIAASGEGAPRKAAAGCACAEVGCVDTS